MLAQEGHTQMQIIQTMLRTILILQFKGSILEKEKTIASVMHLRQCIKSLIPPRGTLCSKDSKFLLEDIDSLCREINTVFEEHSAQLRDANWLSGICSSDESPTFEHVLACLKSCPLHLRTELIKNTICRLIPGKAAPDEYSSTAECW